MNTITITVTSADYATEELELSSLQVSAMYAQNKQLSAKVTELEKKVSSTENTYKYSQEARQAAENEILQAQTLLTALGVAEKNDHAEEYHRKVLPIVTRIALYIAKGK